MNLGKDVIPGLVGHAWGCLLEGYLLDIGTPENYHRAQVEWRTMGGRTNEDRQPDQAKARI